MTADDDDISLVLMTIRVVYATSVYVCCNFILMDSDSGLRNKIGWAVLREIFIFVSLWSV